jgi:membrane-bound lytic murein transglycosylase F
MRHHPTVRCWHRKKSLSRLLAVLAAALLLHTAVPAANAQSPQLRRITASGEITAIIGRSASSYHIYRSRPMGFEYELAREFAAGLGVRLRVLSLNTWEEMVAALMSGKGDFIAAGAEDIPARSSQVVFSVPYQRVGQSIVARRNSTPIGSLNDLRGRTVDVVKGSVPHARLEELRTQGLDVFIRPHARMTVDQLIREVAAGRMDTTVANTNVAHLSQRYYPSVAVQTRIGEDTPLSWATVPEAQELLGQINGFLRDITTSGRLDDVYEKYHWNLEDFDYLDLKTYHERLRTRLPRYRPFIKASAGRYGFDWCLIAAQMYRESHMDPESRGINGALGLMQILPATARGLKLGDPLDPVTNIKAGVMYLRTLYSMFETVGEEDRLKMAMAAYNAGPGHVGDARRLAAEMGLDPNRWDSVAQALPLLRYRKYHRGTEYGFCRGDITVAYVTHILTYYDILKRQEMDTLMARVDRPGERRAATSN